MAYIPSECTIEQYKNAIYNEDARHKIYLSFGGLEYKDIDDNLEKITITSNLINTSNKVFMLSDLIAKNVEIITHDIDTSLIKNDIELKIGTYINDEIGYVYVPIGKFLLQENPTTYNGITTIKLRDYSVKLDKGYNAKPLMDRNGGSATKMQILLDICNTFGIECGVTSFRGDSEVVGVYDNTINARIYVALLADQAGMIAYIDRDGVLQFHELKDLYKWYLPLQYIEKYTNGDAYKISKVIYESGMVKLEKEELENVDGLFPLNINLSKEGQEPIKKLTIDGKCEQTGTPSPDALKEIKTIKNIIQIKNSEDTLNINLQDNELCSIGDIKDELIIENNRAKIIKRIDKIILNGSENWVENNSATIENNYVEFLLPTNDLKYGAKIISNYFPTGKSYNSSIEQIRTRIQAKDIYLNINMSRLSNVSTVAQRTNSFKSWLSENNVIAYYELETLEIIDLGEVEMPKIYNGDNAISLIATLNTSGNISYEDSKNDILYLDSSNPYIINQSQVNSIADKVIGFEINSLKIDKILGNPAIDPWDLISFDDNDSEYNTLGQNTLTYNGKLIQGFNTEISKEKRETNVTKNDEATFRRYVRTTIDNVNLTLENTVGEVNEQGERITSILQNLTEIVSSVQQSGGNNLIKNSVGFAGTTEWEVTKDNEETSKVSTIANIELLQNGTSGGAFQLNGTKLKQSITVNSNDTYTFTCKVKKKAGFSGYIKIYDANNINSMWSKNFANEDEPYFESITFNDIKISGNNLVVELYGVDGSDFVITDSMLSLGNLTTIWTQASGEILNTMVNINMNGVTVKSAQFDETGQYTVISPLEFSGYANKNGVQTRVFTLNGDTTEVENLYAKSTIKLPPLKFVSIKTGSNRGVAVIADWSGI